MSLKPLGGPRISRIRSRQPTALSMGNHFASPRKPRNKRKTTVFVEVLGQDFKRCWLLEELDTLKARAQSTPESKPADPLPFPNAFDPFLVAEPFDMFVPNDTDMEPMPMVTPPQPILTEHKKSVHPDPEPMWLNNKWKTLIPSLVGSLVSYQTSSLGREVCPATNIVAGCQDPTCETKSTSIMCLYMDRECYPY
jgi:hypothetical protein